LKQQEFLQAIKDDLGIGKRVALRLLDEGIGKGFWRVIHGDHNSRLYGAFPLSHSKECGKTGKQNSDCFHVFPERETKKDESGVDNTEFSLSLAGDGKTGEQTPDFLHEEESEVYEGKADIL